MNDTPEHKTSQFIPDSIPMSGVRLDRSEPDPNKRTDIFTFDIETYKWGGKPLALEETIEKTTANYVKPDIIEKHTNAVLEKQALHPETGQIILSGFYDGEQLTHFQGDEKDIINQTVEYINDALKDGMKMITKGGKRFDLPFLLIRAAVLNLKFKSYYGVGYKDLFGKYNHFFHTDLETIFEKGSLQKWAYVLGVTQEIKDSGAEIGPMYDAGNMEGIIEKNTADLAATYNIYRKIEWINI